MKSRLHYSTRICAVCDKLIADEFIVCKEHMEYYRTYKDEPWFKLLVETQRRQFEIDNEQYLLHAGIEKITKPYRKLTESEKEGIKFLWNKGLGAKNISKVLSINYNTVNSFTRALPRTKQTKA